MDTPTIYLNRVRLTVADEQHQPIIEPGSMMWGIDREGHSGLVDQVSPG